jgi:hypothetical protein
VAGSAVGLIRLIRPETTVESIWATFRLTGRPIRSSGSHSVGTEAASWRTRVSTSSKTGLPLSTRSPACT